MKVHELITRLQNFDMYLDVKCLSASTYWAYGEEQGSYEVDTVIQDDVDEVKFIQNDSDSDYILIK